METLAALLFCCCQCCCYWLLMLLLLLLLQLLLLLYFVLYIPQMDIIFQSFFCTRVCVGQCVRVCCTEIERHARTQLLFGEYVYRCIVCGTFTCRIWRKIFKFDQQVGTIKTIDISHIVFFLSSILCGYGRNFLERMAKIPIGSNRFKYVIPKSSVKMQCVYD